MSRIKVIFVIPDMSYLYDYKQQFSLGTLYLSAVLKQEGCDVDIFDSNVHPIKDIPDADIYAFSAVHTTYESCVKLAKATQNIYPGSIYIIGGVYVTLNPAEIDEVFDIRFVGEAEDTIKQFIEHYRDTTPIMSTVYKPEKEVDLTGLFPDRSLLPDDYIRTESIFTDAKTYTEGGATSIMFSRGCPNRCVFCASAEIYHNRMRFRSIEDVVEEVKSVIDTYGIRQFRVQDDTFTAQKRHFIRLAKALEPLGIFYRCSTRANHVDKEVAEWLYRSGCREVGLGIEVADDGILNKLKKGVTLAQMEDAIMHLKRTPMVVRCFFMMGLPFDSPETMQANIDFIERNEVDNIMVSNFIPFPGTAMRNHPEEYNIKGVKTDGFTCLSFASHIPLAPNIQRMDMSEEQHTEIMRVFYDYMMKKGFIH